MIKKRKFTRFSLFASLIAAIGGLLFGYNASVISGALLFLANDFHLTTLQQELVVSTLLIGALLGALLGGFIADHLGRKKTLFLTVILFLTGILVLAGAKGLEALLYGRLISGLAIGIVSMAVPLYIAEMSPPENRGALVSLNQLAITIGIFSAFVITYVYSDSGAWQDMFLFGLIPLCLQFFGLFFIPETPSWLMNHGQLNAAEKILHKIRVASLNEDLVPTEKKEDVPTSKNWRELFSPHIRKAFLIGIGLSVFQQITGINTVMYYAPRIFQLAGFQTAETAIFATMLVGAVNMGMTFIALWLIDLIGRRRLLIAGLIGMFVSLIALGFSFLSTQGEGLAAVAALMFYVAFFAISLGPVAWLIISEIYPLGIRGRAMGIATFANWVCNYFISLTFLTLIDVLGTSSTFWLYGLISLLGLWFVYRHVPETKGKTLEQIQSFWKQQ